jgi:uncharacterized protein
VALSESQSSHLSHRIAAALKKAGAGIPNERLLLNEIKKSLAALLDEDPRMGDLVRRRIATLQRRPPEGSAEYEVLFRQYYEQEQRKRRP